MQDHSITLPGYATDNRHTYRELGRDMTGTLTQPLWEHMRQYHTEYSDENRVVSNDAFAEVIHTIDHDDERGEGVLIPHQHEHGPDGYFVTHPDATVEILEEGQDGARRGGAAGQDGATARGEGAGQCVHCERPIVQQEDGIWIDPEATGDDSIWRETCQTHDTFIANHEPLDEEAAKAWARRPGDFFRTFAQMTSMVKLEDPPFYVSNGAVVEVIAEGQDFSEVKVVATQRAFTVKKDDLTAHRVFGVEELAKADITNDPVTVSQGTYLRLRRNMKVFGSDKTEPTEILAGEIVSLRVPLYYTDLVAKVSTLRLTEDMNAVAPEAIEFDLAVINIIKGEGAMSMFEVLDTDYNLVGQMNKVAALIEPLLDDGDEGLRVHVGHTGGGIYCLMVDADTDDPEDEGFYFIAGDGNGVVGWSDYSGDFNADNASLSWGDEPDFIAAWLWGQIKKYRDSRDKATWTHPATLYIKTDRGRVVDIIVNPHPTESNLFDGVSDLDGSFNGDLWDRGADYLSQIEEDDRYPLGWEG